jgi:hypothetical protein
LRCPLRASSASTCARRSSSGHASPASTRRSRLSQPANWRRPSARRFRAALMSRSWQVPHFGHRHCRSSSRNSSRVYLHPEHVLLEGYQRRNSTCAAGHPARNASNRAARDDSSRRGRSRPWRTPMGLRRQWMSVARGSARSKVPGLPVGNTGKYWNNQPTKPSAAPEQLTWQVSPALPS